MGELAATDRRDEGSPILESGEPPFTVDSGSVDTTEESTNIRASVESPWRLDPVRSRHSVDLIARNRHLDSVLHAQNRDNTTVIALSDRTSDSLCILGRSANCGEGDKIGRCLCLSTTNLGNDEASKRNEHYTEHHHDKR
jgi:hypothetical protein